MGRLWRASTKTLKSAGMKSENPLLDENRRRNLVEASMLRRSARPTMLVSSPCVRRIRFTPSKSTASSAWTAFHTDQAGSEFGYPGIRTVEVPAEAVKDLDARQ